MTLLDKFLQEKFPYLKTFFLANSALLLNSILCHLTAAFFLITLFFTAQKFPHNTALLVVSAAATMGFFYFASLLTKKAALNIKQATQKDLLKRLYESNGLAVATTEKIKFFYKNLCSLKKIEGLLAETSRLLFFALPSIVIIHIFSADFLNRKFTSYFFAINLSLYLLHGKFRKGLTSLTDSTSLEEARFEKELAAVSTLIPGINLARYQNILYSHFDKSASPPKNILNILNLERVGFLLANLGLYSFGFISAFVFIQLFVYCLIMHQALDCLLAIEKSYPDSILSLESIQALSRNLGFQKEVMGGEIDISSLTPSNKQQLALHRAVFAGEQSPHTILDEFSLTFPLHKIISVVAEKNETKKAFFHLLNYTLPLADGKIYVGGKDIRSFQLRSLRTYVHLVSKDPLIFTGTLRTNLALLANEEIEDHEMEYCLNKLGFPLSSIGLDSQINEEDAALTDAIKKKIHLARVLLNKKAELLYIEAPFESLSAEGIRSFLKTLQKVSEEKVAIFLETSHPNDHLEIDYTLFFPEGKNPSLSKHADLLKYNIHYREYFKKDEYIPYNHDNVSPTLEVDASC